MLNYILGGPGPLESHEFIAARTRPGNGVARGGTCGHLSPPREPHLPRDCMRVLAHLRHYKSGHIGLLFGFSAAEVDAMLSVDSGIAPGPAGAADSGGFRLARLKKSQLFRSGIEVGSAIVAAPQRHHWRDSCLASTANAGPSVNVLVRSGTRSKSA